MSFLKNLFGAPAKQRRRNFFRKIFEHLNWGLGLVFQVEVNFSGFPFVAGLLKSDLDIQTVSICG
jgi:hypothetical protein